ncbi:hypothetical protein [Pantanalinema sp. GBBB05]|uniref:hypothetical protein n=1 Tax=Pantanalinema sp. GBBB05 TaxID=2604139 RepID=UPI001DF55F52|nr:hypothetical protein [Pantanalinema sp. GBBB05]
MVNSLRPRIHQLIDQLSDEDLVDIWSVLSELYLDAFMIQAIQASKQSLKPGDTFTREEALRVLPHL